jgi:thioredoxin 1
LTKGDVDIRFQNKNIRRRGGIQVSGLLQVSDSNFDEEIVKAEVPAVVDLWAPWCGPCHMVSPLVEELAQQYDGKFKVAKMNIDENPQTPTRYGIRAIPTILLFKDGELKDTIVGAVGKAHIEKSMLKLMEDK